MTEVLEAAPTTPEDLPRTGLRVEVPVQNFEIRESDEEGDNSVEFEGYGLKWGEEARISSFFFTFTEKFQRGAFKKTLRERGVEGNGQIKFKLRHRAAEPNAAKFIVLKEDATGLRIRGRTIDTRTGRDLAIELREGTLDTFSIAFDSITERFDRDEQMREVLEAKLFEISAVDWPAYAGAQVDAVRSELRDGLPQFLELLESEIREGKVLSKVNRQRLTEARDRIQTVLDSAGIGAREAEPEEDPPEDRAEEDADDGPETPSLNPTDDEATPPEEGEDRDGSDLDLELGLRERELQLHTTKGSELT